MVDLERWRLRWEPAHQNVRRDRSAGWRQAHDLASIGGGWLWPNVTIKSDGLQVVLDARSSQEVCTEPLRYITDQTRVIPVNAFEAGVDDLIERVLARLGEWSLSDTDLCTVWKELAAERSDPESAMYRKIEAILGIDVDDADPRQVEQVIVDGQTLGTEAMSEVAANRFLTARDIQESARTQGFDSDPDGVAEPPADAWNGVGSKAPWQVGTDTVRSLRQREGLGDGPVPDHRLAALYGVEERVLSDTGANGPMAFLIPTQAKRNSSSRSGIGGVLSAT